MAACRQCSNEMVDAQLEPLFSAACGLAQAALGSPAETAHQGMLHQLCSMLGSLLQAAPAGSTQAMQDRICKASSLAPQHAQLL